MLVGGEGNAVGPAGACIGLISEVCVLFREPGDEEALTVPLRVPSKMYSVDLTQQSFSWRSVTDAKGTAPSPRKSHSCWVHRDR